MLSADLITACKPLPVPYSASHFIPFTAQDRSVDNLLSVSVHPTSLAKLQMSVTCCHIYFIISYINTSSVFVFLPLQECCTFAWKRRKMAASTSGGIAQTPWTMRPSRNPLIARMVRRTTASCSLCSRTGAVVPPVHSPAAASRTCLQLWTWNRLDSPPGRPQGKLAFSCGLGTDWTPLQAVLRVSLPSAVDLEQTGLPSRPSSG